MSITLSNGSYSVKFGYDPIFLEAFKSYIPPTGRKWDPERKLWLVDTQYEGMLRHLFPSESIPAASQQKAAIETRMIELRYLGQVKDRGNGDFTAFGLANNTWSVIFPERVLRQWFEGFTDDAPRQSSTLYGVLGISRTATADEIKTAYRRMARQWHPDICREVNAAEVFMRVKDAYLILSNTESKTRYDVGLAFEALAKPNTETPTAANTNYRAPLRCGLVLAEGKESLGRFVVSKIIAFEDITDAYGRTLVVSWPMGADKPVEVWA